jgi:copper chaperone CopZ
MDEATTYDVPQVGTGHCSAAIIEEVAMVEGVQSVEVDLKRRLVRVAGRNVNATGVVAAIYAAGYEAVAS